MFMKIQCSLCTEIDKPFLNYPAGIQASILYLNEKHNHSSVIYCLTGLVLGWTWRPSCSSSLLAAYKLNETGKLLTF